MSPRDRVLVAGILLVSAPLLVGGAHPQSAREKVGPALSAEDRKLLGALLGDPLVDPRGARRVLVKIPVRSVWAKVTGQVEREGWLVPGKAGQPARVHFADGTSLPAPPGEDLRALDFLAACRARLGVP